MTVAGACFVMLGGLVAAITAPLDLERGSWLAAYLVLVCGVAQYAMGWIQNRRYAGAAGSPTSVWLRFGGWNLGNVAVIVGTLATVPLIVEAGSFLLVLVLLTTLRATWSSGTSFGDRAPALTIWTFRILLLILIVSVPVGILLSHLRNT